MCPTSAANPLRAAEQLASDHDPAADPRSHGQQQHVGRTLPRPEPELAPRGHVRVVVHRGGEAGRFANPRGQGELAPGDVRGEAQHTVQIDHAGGAHPDRHHVLPPGHQLPDGGDDGPGRRLGVLGGGVHVPPVQDAPSVRAIHQ